MTRRLFGPTLWILLAVVTAALCARLGPCTAREPDGPHTQPPVAAQGGANRPADAWIRVVRDGQQTPLALQTAIVRYASARSDRPAVQVDLIAAIHVADADYYAQLNRQFEHYDALLYELVAPEGTRVDRGRGASNEHPVGALQNFIKNVLDLRHQLAEIDYTKPNFVHADMSPDQLSRAMAERGESLMKMLFRLMGQSIAQQSKLQAEGKSTDVDLLMAMFAEDRSLQLKRLMADQFDGMESMLVGMGGPEGTALIEGRNSIALNVLKTQIQAGKRKLGVFYGAGHLADMDKKLRRDFDLQPIEMHWLTAWDLDPH